jgi:hypothetical protein
VIVFASLSPLKPRFHLNCTVLVLAFGNVPLLTVRQVFLRFGAGSPTMMRFSQVAILEYPMVALVV